LAGFTLVELLVALAILGLLLALLLPSLQAARESSRRVTCLHNIRQTALATLNYTTAHSDTLPAPWQSQRPAPWDNFSWRVSILPYLDQQAVSDALTPDLAPLDPVNQQAVATPITAYHCPSASPAPRVIHELGLPGQISADLQLASHDVVAIYNVLSEGYIYCGVWHGGRELRLGDGGFSEIQPDEHTARLRARIGRLRNIADGLSKSALLVEQAGKPLGLGTNPQARNQAPVEGAWATCDYGSFWGEGVNTHNFRDPYGFHRGANFAFCDGAVMLIAETVSPRVMVALLSRDGNEIVDTSDWQ
jgi:prepilin-type N-terminal cleavage/methylation domain-containing protein